MLNDVVSRTDSSQCAHMRLPHDIMAEKWQIAAVERLKIMLASPDFTFISLALSFSYPSCSCLFCFQRSNKHDFNECLRQLNLIIGGKTSDSFHREIMWIHYEYITFIHGDSAFDF